MYTLNIKDTGPDLNVVITRAMLALATIAAIAFRHRDNNYLDLSIAAVLLAAAIFTRLLLKRWMLNRDILLFIAAVLLFIVTHSLLFAIILPAYGYLVKYLYRKPMVIVTVKGIQLKKMLSSPDYTWNDFTNVVLKDNLLTLDFKNNRLIQVEIDEVSAPVDENAFNSFCAGYL